MSIIAIVTAMETELNSVKKIYSFEQKNGYFLAKVGEHQLLLALSGIGKVNAALKTKEMIDLGAKLVVSMGVAGGVSSLLNQGDVVISDKVCYHDVWCGEGNQIGQVQDLPRDFVACEKCVQALSEVQGVKVGQIVTGDQFLTDKNRLLEIKKEFPKAMAVDMESAAIAQTCYLAEDVAFLSCRVISDVVGKECQEEQYKNFWQDFPNYATVVNTRLLEALLKENI